MSRGTSFTAIDTNVAQSLSVSWGFWEYYDNLEFSPVTDPITGQTVGEAQAAHELFVRAAIQGQTLFRLGHAGCIQLRQKAGS